MLSIDTGKALARGISGSSKDVVSTEGGMLFLLSLAFAVATAALTRQILWTVPIVLIGLYLMFSVKVADQWKKRLS